MALTLHRASTQHALLAQAHCTPSIAEVYGRSSGDAKAGSLGTLMWGQR